jgi:Permeases of the major facilitator superfamily
LENNSDHLKSDIILLFSTRIIRLFAYGFLSVVLVLYLAEIGLSAYEIGLLLSLTLLGDVTVSLWITTVTDRIGRKRMLIFGSVLMVSAGAVFVFTKNPIFLTIAAIVGIISPSGNEIGPFLSIEQASLSQLFPDEERTHVFGWYNLVGSFATALGALSSGWLATSLLHLEFTPVDSYRVILFGYAACGLVLVALFIGLSAAVETGTTPTAGHRMGLHRSKNVVIKLSALFSLDAFAGGFIIQSLLAYWFHIRFGVDVGILGSVFLERISWQGFQRCLPPGWQNYRARQHDGFYPYSVKCAAVPDAPDAEPYIGNNGAVAAVQYFANGCAYPAILYDGGSCSG